jgi:chemotaxis family two-component system response regulator Rcp1
LAPTNTASLLVKEEAGILTLEADDASALTSVLTFPLPDEFLMTLSRAERAIDILLVEDNPADVRLTREIFENGDGSTRLNVVGDGEQAMAFLRREGPYADSPRPQLVLLDLNLPRKDGREVLEELKADSNLCRIPVVVLTTSGAESDISRSYELQANCYITKPVDLDEFFSVVGSIKDFWLANARLPSL